MNRPKDNLVGCFDGKPNPNPVFCSIYNGCGKRLIFSWFWVKKIKNWLIIFRIKIKSLDFGKPFNHHIPYPLLFKSKYCSSHPKFLIKSRF